MIQNHLKSYANIESVNSNLNRCVIFTLDRCRCKFLMRTMSSQVATMLVEHFDPGARKATTIVGLLYVMLSKVYCENQ